MERKRAGRFSIQLLDAVYVDLNRHSVNSVFLAENGRSGTTQALLVNHRSEDRYVFELLSQGCSVLTLREKPVAAGRITLSVAIRKVMEIFRSLRAGRRLWQGSNARTQARLLLKERRSGGRYSARHDVNELSY